VRRGSIVTMADGDALANFVFFHDVLRTPFLGTENTCAVARRSA